jgi:sulfatase maturation enzyme AslB (radical SAM superfamily)
VALLCCEVEPSGPTGGAKVRALLDLAFPCNLSCAGCARGRHGGLPEGAAVAAVAARLAARAGEDGVEDVVAVFFGGEPLLDVDTVTQASRQVRDVCAAAGRGYEAAVLTNGLLLDRLAAGHLAGAGFTTVQLTTPSERGADGRRLLDVRRIDRIVRAARAAREELDVLVRIEVSGSEELRQALTLVRILEQEGVLSPPRAGAVLLGPRASYAAQARALLLAPAARRAAFAALGQSPMIR